MKKILTLILAFVAFNANAQQVVQVADINVGAGSSSPFQFVEFNNEMYFTAASNGSEYKLWKYDGVNTPIMIPDSNTNSTLYPGGFISFNGKLYFTYGDPTYGTGEGIWMYDGVNPPTLLANMNPTGTDLSSADNTFIEFNGKLYFSGSDGMSGYEFWVYDGVSAPSMVTDINSGTNGSSPKAFTIFQNKLYFVAYDGNASNLMIYDGINPPSITYSNLKYNTNLEIMNNKLYMTALTNAADPYTATIFEYDGLNTPTVTSNLGVLPSYYVADIYESFWNKIYFYIFPDAGGASQYWVYESSGSVLGDSLSGISTSGIMYNNEVYYSSSHDGNGIELWKYDGINAPIRLTNINTNGSSTGSKPFAFQNKLYFTATDGITNYELWSYDPHYLSISQIENGGNISLYPNPTNSDITIQFDQTYKANIELINTLGQVIMSKQSNDMFTNITMPQEQGIYFVRITINGKSTTQKVVKQ